MNPSRETPNKIIGSRLARTLVVLASTSLPMASALVWNHARSWTSILTARPVTSSAAEHSAVDPFPEAAGRTTYDGFTSAFVPAHIAGGGVDNVLSTTPDAVGPAVFAAEREVAGAAALERERAERARRRRQTVAAAAAEEAAKTADQALRSIRSQVEDMAATVSAAASTAATRLAELAPAHDPEAALVASRLAATVAAAAASLTEQTALAAVTVALAASRAAGRAAEAEAEAANLDAIDDRSAAAAASKAATAHIATVRELARVTAAAEPFPSLRDTGSLRRSSGRNPVPRPSPG